MSTGIPEDADELEISVEEARRILDKQTDAYYRIQEQVQRLIRTLIALLVVLTSVLSIAVQSNQPLLRIGDFETHVNQSANEIGLSLEVTEAIATDHRTAGLIMAFSGAIALVGMIAYIILSLAAPSLEPGLSIHQRYQVTIQPSLDLDESDYETWIEHNSAFISKIGNRVSYSYKLLAAATFFFLFSGVLMLLGHFAVIGVIFFLDLVVVSVSATLLTTYYYILMTRSNQPIKERVMKAVVILALGLFLATPFLSSLYRMSSIVLAAALALPIAMVAIMSIRDYRASSD